MPAKMKDTSAVAKWMIKNGVTQTEMAKRVRRGNKHPDQGAVSRWVTRGVVSPGWVVPVHKVTGIPMHKLNPVFPK